MICREVAMLISADAMKLAVNRAVNTNAPGGRVPPFTQDNIQGGSNSPTSMPILLKAQISAADEDSKPD